MWLPDRFTSVTTARQTKNGTIVIRDNENPGVYFASYDSGWVRKIVTYSDKIVIDYIDGDGKINKSNETPWMTRRSIAGINRKSSIGVPFLIKEEKDRIAYIYDYAVNRAKDLDLSPIVSDPQRGWDHGSRYIQSIVRKAS
jgi:hypothetical protein